MLSDIIEKITCCNARSLSIRAFCLSELRMNTQYYMDLNPLVERDGVKLDEVLLPGMIDGYYDADGKLEGFPLHSNCFYMAINKDMFDNAGVAYPEAGWTMNDLLDWGTKFVSGEGANQTFAIAKHWVMLGIRRL